MAAGLRITGGALRGRVVPGPVRGDVRPTGSRVREALFNLLGQDLTGSSVLDAFTGSGVLAFEAWSRGARPVTVCDRSAAALHHVRASAASLGVDLEIVGGDATRLLAGGRQWDVVLLDPPYADDPVVWLERAAASTGAIVVAETTAQRDPPPRVGRGLLLDRRRVYGDSALWVYRPGADA
jgi:16S rRNA (guanine966-N2)-methyltransferase